MKDLLKNQYKNVILVISYIVVATTVYTVCADCVFERWYIDLITAIFMISIGIVIGYFYIKSEEVTRLKKLEEDKNSSLDENNNETKEVVEIIDSNNEKNIDNKNENEA